MVSSCSHFFHIECIVNKLNKDNQTESKNLCSYCDDIFAI